MKVGASLQGAHMYNIIYISANVLIILITLVNIFKLNVYERVQQVENSVRTKNVM